MYFLNGKVVYHFSPSRYSHHIVQRNKKVKTTCLDWFSLQGNCLTWYSLDHKLFVLKQKLKLKLFLKMLLNTIL